MSSDSTPAPAARVPLSAAALWVTACFLAVYLPDVGRGFVKDDYGWIASSHVTGLEAIRRMFSATPMGFYRPLVSLSFGVNEWLSRGHAFGYALVNVALVLAIGTAIAWLARRLGLPRGAALFAAAVWAFNFHGINMALLWISGRTSLLETFFAVLAACAFVTRRHVSAGALTIAALLCKEEVLLLPVVFAAWWLIARIDRSDPDGPQAWVALAPPVVAAIAYLIVRAQTSALTPATAPGFYQLSPSLIPANSLQYLDRSLTFPAALLLLGALGVSRRSLALTRQERSAIAKGLVWLALGFAVTIMVPVRSSLYVCLPTVGSALAAGAIGSALWRAMKRPQLAMALLLVLPLALLPVYRARNLRMKNEARLAAHALATIGARVVREHPGRILIVDDAAARPSMADAFGDTLPLALQLFVPETAGTPVIVIDADAARAPGDVTLAVRDGRLVDVGP